MLIQSTQRLAAILMAILLINACTKPPKQEIILTVDDAFYPYMYLEEDTPKGLYTEIVTRVASQIVTFETKVVAKRWNEALSDVKSGTAHGLVGTYKLTEKRPWLTHYSEPIFEEEIVFICAAKHRGTKFEVFPRDFVNMLIVNIADYDGWLNYNPRNKDFTDVVNFFEAPNIETAFKMTAQGNVDCAIFERMSYNYMLNKHTNTAKDSSSMPYVAMSFKKDNAFVGFNSESKDAQVISAYKKQFDATLQKMRENGELDDLIPE